jgi:hypothetical protein
MTPFNFLEQSGKLWQAWSEQQQNLLKAIAGTMPGVGAMPAAALPSLESGLAQVQDLWRGVIEKWMSLAPQGLARTGNVDEILKALFDPLQWSKAGLGPLDRAIEHLVDGPSYATLWTLDRKILRAQKLRADWARDLAAWQLVMQSAWNGALQRFVAAVHEKEGEPIRTWRELADMWIGIANDALTETHRTPEFLEAQRRLTRSSTECRLAEREIMEAYCEMHHIPTRTEVDELARSVYELRREVRALKRDAHPAPAAAKRAPRKRRR